MKRKLKVSAFRTSVRLAHQVRAKMTPDTQQWCYHLAVVIVGGFSLGNLFSDIWHWQRVVFPIA
jgi:hypothetical protein